MVCVEARYNEFDNSFEYAAPGVSGDPAQKAELEPLGKETQNGFDKCIVTSAVWEN
jgi:hypothetical protein